MRMLSNLLILIAVGVGLLTGWFDNHFLNQTAHVTSELFLRLLKLISLPIIFLAVTSTITGMKNLSEIKRMGRKVVFYTLLTTLIAATVALSLYLLIDPAGRVSNVGQMAAVNAPQGSYLSFVMNIIPANFIEAFLKGNVIGIVFISIFLSVSILFLPDDQKNFLHKLFSSFFAAMLKVTSFIIRLMPIAVWAFVTLLFKELNQNYAHFNNLLLYLCCVVGANLIQGIVVLPILLKIKGISPWKAFRAMGPALSMAFFSKSSSAALPLTMQSIEENGGVSKKVSSFSLPLCSVVNMNGCAAFILISTLFVATLNGMTFGTFDFVGWIFFATIAAIGNAGVPMGCFFLTSAFLIGMHVPLHLMGLILPFYAIIDMIETALNVWSDSCVTMSIDKDLKAAEAAAETIEVQGSET
ncbi:MAG: Proton/glutamate-aspartate symporter [Chlamydiales bacterium]|nr:Proton/glutamate-aspartate symporter [Chlamydiales bacterium]MCH9619525.1 Proton/glutamate-aspartate symporter [Chlamydiales bacterium]MCH9623131.1 Proton/glutamate-aspartate symporter [Chlamydiales bacterium]